MPSLIAFVRFDQFHVGKQPAAEQAVVELGDGRAIERDAVERHGAGLRRVVAAVLRPLPSPANRPRGNRSRAVCLASARRPGSRRPTAPALAAVVPVPWRWFGVAASWAICSRIGVISRSIACVGRPSREIAASWRSSARYSCALYQRAAPIVDSAATSTSDHWMTRRRISRWRR